MENYSANGHFLNERDSAFGFEWTFINEQLDRIATEKTKINLAIQKTKQTDAQFMLDFYKEQQKQLKAYKVKVNQYIQSKNPELTHM